MTEEEISDDNELLLKFESVLSSDIVRISLDEVPTYRDEKLH